jgi:SAM-dependent methyltransferase
MKNVHYIGLDLDHSAIFASVAGDLTDIPLADSSVDNIICIHVLEHVEDDRKAMAEMYRVLKPGGLAFITVPILEDEPTREDPSITAPEERKRVFGERSHVRYYGLDIRDRLESVGFNVDFEPAGSITETSTIRYGLRKDENIFLCTKAA